VEDKILMLRHYCKSLYVCMCANVCMYVCVCAYVCTYVCTYVCVCMYDGESNENLKYFLSRNLLNT